MIISPIRGLFRISQSFGGNPKTYKQFGLNGHNGQDIAVPIGTQIFSPIDGEVEVMNSFGEGYGLHVRITEKYGDSRRQVVLAHLSKTDIQSGANIKAGQLVGLSGNSGFSTGAHLHWGLRRLNKEGSVINYNNGYFGYEDIFEQGWITKNEPSIY